MTYFLIADIRRTRTRTPPPIKRYVDIDDEFAVGVFVVLAPASEPTLGPTEPNPESDEVIPENSELRPLEKSKPDDVVPVE
jgi:hypothetical protein